VFENELYWIVVAVEDDLRLEALERGQASLAVESFVKRLGDCLAVVGVLIGGANRCSLEAVVLEAAGSKLANVLFDNAAGVFDIFEPVDVVAPRLWNVPDGPFTWGLVAEFKRCLVDSLEGAAQLGTHSSDGVLEVATVVPPEDDRIVVDRLVDGTLDSIVGALRDGFRCWHG